MIDDSYVEVSTRIENFYAKHPEGSLQGEGEFIRDEQGRIYGYVYRAQAFRSPEDTCPGVGTAFEPIPGKTNFTRDSEVMNAETSAWGRAIVACGFPSKHIASANEVRARQDSGGQETRAPAGDASPPPGNPSVAGGAQTTGATSPASPSAAANPAAQAQAAYEANRLVPDDAGDPANVEVHFGKNRGVRLGSLNKGQLGWYANTWDPDKDPRYPSKPEDRRLKLAAQILMSGGGAQELARAEADDLIPFAPVPV